MSTLVRRGAVGRVHAHRLFAYNAELKKEAVRTRGYWDENKDAHPINRWSYRRWQRRRQEATVFERTASQLPPDQQYKLRRSLIPYKVPMIGPALFIGYFAFCYVRYALWGVTPIDGGAAIVRSARNLPRAV